MTYPDDLPTEGMFGRGAEVLDPRLYDGTHLKPGVREGILATLASFWDPRYPSWRSWARVYIAGSGASYWWTSDADLDVLIGIDGERVARTVATFEGQDEITIAKALSVELKVELHPLTMNWTTPAGDGPFDLTFFVNPGSYDILDINPYAAYDVTRDLWVQRPPHLPPDWGPHYFPESWWDRAATVAEQVEEVLIGGSVEDATEMFNDLKAGRQKAYSLWGKGWLDWGNFIYQFLHLTGHLQALYRVKHGESPRASLERLRERDLTDVVK